MQDMSIGEVAEAAGIRPSAIRYYEREGLLPQPMRVGGKRRYSRKIVDELAQIRWGRAVGFTIAELRILREGLNSGHAPSEVWKHLAERKLRDVRAAIRAAQRMERTLKQGLQCTCRSLPECRLRCEDAER